jgi:copper(I)-binding protein
MSYMLLRTLIPAAAFMLAACSGPADAPAGESVIEVKDAFIVKPAEGRDVAAGGLMAYVTGSPVELVGASTDVADRVELHTMTMEDNVMQMRQVESFTVYEGEPVVLQRGGNHLMLFGVDPAIAVGDTVDISLEFRDSDGTSQTLVTSAEVKGLGD